MRRLVAVAALVVLVAAAGLAAALTGNGDETATGEGGEPESSTTSRPSTTAPPTTASTTTLAPPPATLALPPIPTDGDPAAVVSPAGLVLPALGQSGNGWLVRTPCAREATVPEGMPLLGAHVVLDPGHGGDEQGAVAPNGLEEKTVNLQVAEEVERLLEQAGATVVLTRTADYRVALRVRGEIANRLQPAVFLSIHHNAEPDGPSERPGSETFYQIDSADSRRLAGLVYEEAVAAFSAYDIAWAADTDAGAKYRRAGDGGDYYGVLRRTAGVPAVLTELAYMSNPPEAELLATPEFRAVEAAAITRAVVRYLTTQDPGSGFTEPYPRSSPAGPGGGLEGCVDPPL